MIMVVRHFGRRMRRPMRMLAPIVSYKHQRQEDVTYVGGGANNNTIVFTGDAPGAAASLQGVPAGNKVYSVDVSVNYIQESSSGNSILNWMLVHLRDDQTVNTLFAATQAANWTTIGQSKGRNQVIKSFLGLVGSEDAGPRVYNLHIKIPKMWHRVREGDQLILSFHAENAGSLSIGTRFKSFS